MPDDRDTPRITLSIPPALLRQVDDFRFSNRVASRAEVIRQLLETALKVKTKDQSK